MTWDRVRTARSRLERESGTIIKDWGGRLPFALVYPNSYSLGMSNLGIQAVYSLLNASSRVVCERVFWEEERKGRPSPPVSIESQRQLPDFAVLAFSVTYELDYFNIPRILAAAGIPLYSAERDGTHPLVIAGGVCISANPAPVAPFFDALCVGEAEAILPDLVKTLSELDMADRQGALSALAGVQGMFVPGTSNHVSLQRAKNLDDFPVHSVVMTRETELGDLYLVEVERGCRWRCRFCLVCGVFRPMRPRSIESIVQQAETGLASRRRIGLVGPDVPDHPAFEEILLRLKAMDAEVSVSSLRIKPLFDLALSELARGGTGTVAFAPEAGSARMRGVIRKGVNEDDILKAVEFTSRHNLKQLRLYFMIGLPTETDDDVEAIVEISRKCKAVLERRQSTTRIVLSVSPFVPKAGTPFQWAPMERLGVLNRRLAILRRSLQAEGIRVTGESPAWSEVQAILARGDTSLAPVLAGMKDVSLAVWSASVQAAQFDLESIHSAWEVDRKLPWAIIDSGVSLDYMKRELASANSPNNGNGDSGA